MTAGQAPLLPRRPTTTATSPMTQTVAPLQNHPVLTLQPAGEPPRQSRPLFDGLQPLVYAGALFGIVPIALRPLRLSFHPLRSTLLYGLLLQAFVWWDAYIRHLWPESPDDAALEGAHNRFLYAHASVHLAGSVIAPVFWAEARNIRRLLVLSDSVMEDFGWVLWGPPPPTARGHSGFAIRPTATALRRPQRPQQVAVWFTVVSMFIFSPSMVLVWSSYVGQDGQDQPGGGGKRTGAHTFVNNYLMFGAGAVCVCSLRLRTFASGLLAELEREVADPNLTPERVLKYRRAWKNLASLSSDLVVTPVSMLLVTIIPVVIVTLHSYETVERITAGDTQSALVIGSVGVPFLLLLFLPCEIPHRTADVIRGQFMHILQTTYCRYKNENSSNELHRFLKMVWWNSPITSIGGYFNLRRSSLKAIVTVVVTYVIVILQFHLSLSNSTGLSNLNGTLSAQVV